MIPKNHFVNKLRELGYKFKEQKDRTELWRKMGSIHCVYVPRRDQLSEAWVKATLNQCGLSANQIEAFIQDANA